MKVKNHIDLGVFDLKFIFNPKYTHKTRLFRHNNFLSGDWNIYLFEPNPEQKKVIENSKYSCKYITYIDKAAWIYDGILRLYNGCKSKSISAVPPNKYMRKYVDYSKWIDVDCIDFSKWIIENFKKTDYIQIRMNIEGSEYYILSKMILDGSIDYFDLMHIKFHRKEYGGVFDETQNKIRLELKKRKIEYIR